MKWLDFVEHLGCVASGKTHHRSYPTMLYRKTHWLFLGLVFCLSPLCSWSQVELHVLGITQDAGLPQLGCAKSCCVQEGKPRERVPVVALGITQSDSKQGVLIEATPDIGSQWQRFMLINQGIEPSSIFITHAHMGHYSGLLQLGREARNTKGVTVYGHPTLIDFLQRDQPWKQLVALNNILPKPIRDRETIQIGQLSIRALVVPHRDEISATYAYILEGPTKRALFLPDIDKWEKWQTSILDLIKEVDYAFLDGTFYDSEEINHRDISEIPHPFIIESLELFKNLSIVDKSKVYFIHLNHTNPAIDKSSAPFKNIISLYQDINSNNYNSTIFIEASSLSNNDIDNSYVYYSSQSPFISKLYPDLKYYILPLLKFNNELFLRNIYYLFKNDDDWVNRNTINKSLINSISISEKNKIVNNYNILTENINKYYYKYK